MPELARYSDVDTRRFGKRIYRAHLQQLADVQALENQSRVERIDMIIARCPVTDARLAQALEASGYRLMDTLVHYAGPTSAFENATWPHSIRQATADDRDELANVASDAFSHYGGHYHADPRLDSRLSTLGYVDWCLGCLARPDYVMWVAVEDAAITGFVAVTSEDGTGVIELNGVASRFQRRGVYGSLVKAAGRAFVVAGTSQVRSSAHLGNLAPQRVWIRNGMSITSAVYTFHKWLDV